MSTLQERLTESQLDTQAMLAYALGFMDKKKVHTLTIILRKDGTGKIEMDSKEETQQ